MGELDAEPDRAVEPVADATAQFEIGGVIGDGGANRAADDRPALSVSHLGARRHQKNQNRRHSLPEQHQLPLSGAIVRVRSFVSVIRASNERP